MNHEQAGSGTPQPPAAWYADPNDASRLRYRDGESWTEHYAPIPRARATARGVARAVGAQQASSGVSAVVATGKGAGKMASRLGASLRRGRREPSGVGRVARLGH